ncbi:butyrophilin subfamily 1 member A1-like [Paramisgurnus dabryanus]|uniref:butyrophilin subfamily 1 member A1-like n=1 Tax=Paramisgurnus dabryanus TaxID=90735 RepID=UPI0031F3AF9F
MKFIYVILLSVTGITHLKADEYGVVGPVGPVMGVSGEDVILPCSLKHNISAVDMRVEWFRLDLKGSVVHLYKDHEDKNTDQLRSYRGRTQLFKDELQKGNTSLKLSKVDMSDEGVYKCFIQSESWYDDITLDLKVEDQSHSWKTTVILVSVFVLLCLIGGILIAFFIRKKKELQRKKESAEQKIQYENRKINNEREKLLQKENMTVEREIALLRKYAVNVTLDPDSAHPRLAVSPNEKQVRFKEQTTVEEGDAKRNYTFDTRHCVLGNEGFTFGFFYFEVKGKGLPAWHVGVAKESAYRKGSINFSPQYGYWAVRIRDKAFEKCTNPLNPPPLSEEPQTVGVFVDFEAGRVSFYDVDSKRHINSFTEQTFDEKLYPMFYLGQQLSEDPAPLTIWDLS